MVRTLTALYLLGWIDLNHSYLTREIMQLIAQFHF